jgi:hypothetical protein
MAGGTGLHLFVTPLAQATTLVAAAICLAAAIWGRRPERLGGLVVAVNWVGSALLQDRRWNHHGQPAVFAADAAMLVAFLLIAMRWRRSWVLWAAACALLLNFTDLSLLLDTRIQLWSYVSASYVWGLGVALALAAGVAFEGRRPAPVLMRPASAARRG